MAGSGFSKALCLWYLLSHFGDSRKHESSYIDLMSLILEQSREIQRIPQEPLMKRLLLLSFNGLLVFILPKISVKVFFSKYCHFCNNICTRISFWLIYLFLPSQTKFKYVFQHPIGKCLVFCTDSKNTSLD